MDKEGARNSKINWGERFQQPMEKEITIKIKPKQFLKGFIVVVLLVAVFCMGRFSAESASCGLTDVSDFFGSFGSHGTAAAVAEKTEINTATVANSSGAGEAEGDTVAEETEVTGTTGAETAAVNSSSDETIVTSYANVALAVDEMYKSWKGTWGRMTGFSYSIKNNEAGTILPDHFVMKVKGYDDIEKTFDVPYTSQKVKAGQVLEDEAAISGGFAYSPITIKDLTAVQVSLYLYDSAGKVIAYTVQPFDLGGEKEE